MMPIIKFSLGMFQQTDHDTFILSDKNAKVVYNGKNPVEAMVIAQGMYETAVRNQFLPLIQAEGYNRLGVKVDNDPRGIQQNCSESS